eukprot:442981_1
MSTVLSQKRSLNEIDDDNNDWNDEWNEQDNDEFDNDDGEWDNDDIITVAEPPLKKRKIATDTNININNDMDIDTNTNTNTNTIDSNHDTNITTSKDTIHSNITPTNHAIILISGLISQDDIHNICINLTKNNFLITKQKPFKMKSDELNTLFFESPNSSIEIGKMAEIELLDQFTTNKTNYAIAITNETNDIFKQLISYSKSYNNYYYFTLNKTDYIFKYKLLFTDAIFFAQLEKDNDNCMSEEAKKNINVLFYEEKFKLEMERFWRNMRCCCIPINMSQHEKYGTYYREQIQLNGINTLAMDIYRLSIERSINIFKGALALSIDGNIMDIINGFLGKVVKMNNDKENIKHYKCEHCKVVMNVRVNIVKKKKKEDEKKKVVVNDKERLCEICNKIVPANELNWKQHIEGKKHQKKFKAKLGET